MKLNMQIISMLIVIFLSVNIYGQNRLQKLAMSSFDNNKESMYDSKENIIVISIVDFQNPNEFENLNKLAKKYKNDNVQFIAVTDKIDDNEFNLLKVQLSHYKYLSKDENEKVFNMYQTNMFKVFPIQILINANGKMKYKKKGRANNIEDKLSKRIDRFLYKKINDIKHKEFQFAMN
ncbi:hypothetical protein [uncultured Lutibacter sp.]|uniref:TlpA family protein disulfide reductase n=1 Tax=uncultured Lutibacter sp. TaxID=437739 RepID=UPI00263035BB|nr:hypothetical protein [uncultured Lutibacter sp.]